MPSSDDQAGLVLELTRLARASGLTLEGITPLESAAVPGAPSTVPVSVVVNGRYHDVARFVQALRLLVQVEDGEVAARGRLLSVRSISLVEADNERYPQLDATIELDAYVYDGPVAPVELPDARGRGGALDAHRQLRGGSGIVTPEARAARERKQKIFVAVGGLFLLALLAFQLPKLMGGGSSAASTTTTTTSTTPGSPAPEAPGTPTPGATPVALVDTDRALPVGVDQLRSFSSFRVKDPFVQQVVEPEPAPVRTAPAQPAKSKPKTPSKDFSAGSKANAAATVISVNGVRYALEPGAKFPTADPVLVLVSVRPGAKTAVVGVPGGKYENGSKTTKLEVGKPLVLVNTTTKSRYRLVLVKVGAKR